jgi:hypothetical protein
MHELPLCPPTGGYIAPVRFGLYLVGLAFALMLSLPAYMCMGMLWTVEGGVHIAAFLLSV